MRRAAAALVALLAVAGAAAAATPVRATLRTGTPTPVVDEPWRWTVVVKDSRGRAVAARMRLQILFAGTVVGCWKAGAIAQCSGANSGAWISFRGKRTGVLMWPAESVGVTLTFRAIVVVGRQTVRLRSPVTVQPKP
jgi:hypothetical protein